MTRKLVEIFKKAFSGRTFKSDLIYNAIYNEDENSPDQDDIRDMSKVHQKNFQQRSVTMLTTMIQD